MNSQNWNAQEYKINADFVAKLGNSVLEILDPKPGEKILDLGCGDGKLTLEIQNYGCQVLGIDSSEEMINATRKLGIDKTKFPPVMIQAFADFVNNVPTEELVIPKSSNELDEFLNQLEMP